MASLMFLTRLGGRQACRTSLEGPPRGDLESRHSESRPMSGQSADIAPRGGWPSKEAAAPGPEDASEPVLSTVVRARRD